MRPVLPLFSWCALWWAICGFVSSPTWCVGIQWNADVISISSTAGLRFIGPWFYDIDIHSNGPIDESSYYSINRGGGSNSEHGGHFRFAVTIETASSGNLTGVTPCIPVWASGPSVGNRISHTMLYPTNSSSILISNNASYYELSSFLTVSVKRYYSQPSTIQASTSFAITFTGAPVLYMWTSGIDTVTCPSPRTIGNWNDPLRWDLNRVPNNNDDVTFPLGTGVVMTETDVTINGVLTITDGIFRSQRSACPAGWSSSPYGLISSKCYKLFESMATFSAAEKSCSNSGLGSLDAHLIQISNYDEEDILRRMCRGTSSSRYGP
jgi:hypothetical protein